MNNSSLKDRASKAPPSARCKTLYESYKRANRLIGWIIGAILIGFAGMNNKGGFIMVKSLFYILCSISLLVGCKSNDPDISGLYLAENNAIFYALRINDQHDSIELFILKEHSTSDSLAQIEKRKDFLHSKKGFIKYEEGNIRIVQIESDPYSNNNNKMPDFIVDHGRIRVNCETLTGYYFKLDPTIGCRSDEIIFSRKNN